MSFLDLFILVNLFKGVGCKEKDLGEVLPLRQRIFSLDCVQKDLNRVTRSFLSGHTFESERTLCHYCNKTVGLNAPVMALDLKHTYANNMSAAGKGLI